MSCGCVAAGDKKLSELFGDHDQLIVVHFMFPPEWERGCSSCSLWADGYSGNVAHINRKAAFVAVGKAPIHKISSFKEWKGWAFPFYSSGKNTFNRDFGVEFTPDEVRARVACCWSLVVHCLGHVHRSGGSVADAPGSWLPPCQVSSGAKLFNYGRTFPVTQGPGYSVFFKGPDGTVYHTYSTYARGMEQVRPAGLGCRLCNADGVQVTGP